MSWLIILFRLCTLLVMGTTVTFNAIKADAPHLWDALKGDNHLVLIRHALAPGSGDPGPVDLNDCLTQRNLSEIGRQQAQSIGNLFKANSISTARIYTSQWCRCRETAELLNLGNVSDMVALNSFFQRPENEARQLTQFKEWLKTANLSHPTVLVTHQVVITGLTGYFPSSGEIVFVKRDASNTLRITGTIDTL